ncbi:MAG: efflux RND transporter periplasmic adaptor subunit [Syntrophomonas sp.]
MSKIAVSKRAAIIIVICLVITLVTAGYFLAGKTVLGKGKQDLIVQSTLEMTEVNINAQIAGQIKQINVKEGDKVAKGQILAVVNSDTLLAQKAQSEASIDTMQAQISKAQAAEAAARAMLQKTVKGARAEEIAQTKASYDLKKDNYTRMSSLFDNGAISKAALEAAATEYENAKQQYNLLINGARQEDITVAQANVNQASSSVTALEGQLKQAEASLAEIKTYIDKTIITAPADGIVTQLNVEAGELVSTGLPIAIITGISDAWIKCNMMENKLGQIQPGQAVLVEFPAYPGKTFHGRVATINKSADFAVKRATNLNGDFDVRAYGVKVVLEDVNKPLYAGMTAFVNFSAERKASL